VRVSVFPNFSVQAAYEGGYKKSGSVGLYQDESTLRISGLEISTILWYRFSHLKPYVQLGGGYYFYRQDVDNDLVRFQVDHKKVGFILGGGVDIDLYKGLFFSLGIKYVQLEVQPFNVPVDLSGIRILCGIGWGIEL
jgi:opacity protein-like surface antigen